MLSVLLVMVTTPLRLFSVPAAVVLKAMLAFSAPNAVPEMLIALLVKLKSVTVVPPMP